MSIKGQRSVLRVSRPVLVDVRIKSLKNPHLVDGVILKLF